MKGFIPVHEFDGGKKRWINPDHIVEFMEESIKGTKQRYTFVRLTTTTMSIKETKEEIFELIYKMYN
jgi:hypothetical protein